MVLFNDIKNMSSPPSTKSDLSQLFPLLQPTGTIQLPVGSIVQPDFIQITQLNQNIKLQLEILKQRRLSQKQQLLQPGSSNTNTNNDIIDLTETSDTTSSSHTISHHSSAAENNVRRQNDYYNSNADEFMSIAEYAVKPSIRPSIPSNSTAVLPEHTHYKQYSPILRLHEEIIDFCSYVSPTVDEHNIRDRCIQRLTDIVHSTFSTDVRVIPFGSYATRLYLPISDIDICIFGAVSHNNQSILQILADSLKLSNTCSYIELITKARIPIIKLIDKSTNIKIDISFDIDGGIHAAQYLNQQLQVYPAMRPLVIILKYYLHCRQLNETYTGGIGSFVLQMLVLNYLQLHPQFHINHKMNRNNMNLGILLMSFLELYGRIFNYYTVGIYPASKTSANGVYYNKYQLDRYNSDRPYLLSIENPLDSTHDISANSYQILKIRRTFYYAYMRLLHELQNNSYHSMLSTILSIDPDMNRLRPKLQFKSMHDGTDLISNNNTPVNKLDNNGNESESSTSNNTTVKIDALASQDDFISFHSDNAAIATTNNNVTSTSQLDVKKRKKSLDSLFRPGNGGMNPKHHPNTQTKKSHNKIKHKHKQHDKKRRIK